MPVCHMHRSEGTNRVALQIKAEAKFSSCQRRSSQGCHWTTSWRYSESMICRMDLNRDVLKWKSESQRPRRMVESEWSAFVLNTTVSLAASHLLSRLSLNKFMKIFRLNDLQYGPWFGCFEMKVKRSCRIVESEWAAFVLNTTVCLHLQQPFKGSSAHSLSNSLHNMPNMTP